MIIGIDIRVLGSKVKSGIEEYTENLLAHLLPLDKNIKFKLFFSSFGGDIKKYNWLSPKNVELYKFRIPNRFLFLSSGLANQPKIDKLIGGADVFFSPHFFLTSLSFACKRVTTFHDLSYIHYPELFLLRQRVWHNFEMNPSWQSRFSDKIISVSRSTKNDLIKIYGIDPAKIEVIYSGISQDMKRPSENELYKFRIKHNLPDRFILSLGKLEPRKNIPSLIKAFNVIKDKRNFQDLKLVIIGSKGWLYDDIFKEVQNSNYRDDIVLKSFIPDQERKFYYSLAQVFVYPSLFEGFGFPPLEAMACGTPVIVSNSSSLPEIVSNAGLLVKPNDIYEIANLASLILIDRKLKDHLASVGYNRSTFFDWNKTAEKTLNCLLSSVK